MKRNFRQTNPWLHYGILFLIYGVAVATLFTHTVYHALAHGSSDDADDHHHAHVAVQACPPAPFHTYRMTLTGTTFSPATVTAKRCDKLIITSNDNRLHKLAMGPHEHHIDYPGFQEKVLSKGQSNAFVLYQRGTFPLHDHYDEGIRGTLVVK